ncbi:MAG: hypothetical protein NTV00_03350 [Methylococcales bacterium]|nr:hypothetical protein [Methylococcales bacterium]
MSQYPYAGLRPFQREETDIFFGREEHTDELLNHLASIADSSSMMRLIPAWLIPSPTSF